YQTLQELTSQQNSLIDNRIMDKASGGVPEKAARTFSEDESAKESFSDTNIQVEGVDEGDIVKTDGEYLYVLDRDYVSVSIVKAK
ncbi:beta-propeller domain-containing protein, partial [Pseudomonas aeruginosa]|nr:beta-propeller domain-containing protein [Pseudomonas aeruginosa]